MLCPLCQAICTPEDNYCYRCGAPVKVRPLPVRARAGLPSRPQASPLARLVAKGIAYLALGALGHWAAAILVRSLARWALRSITTPRSLLPARHHPKLPPAHRAHWYQEIIVVWRRLEHIEGD